MNHSLIKEIEEHYRADERVRQRSIAEPHNTDIAAEVWEQDKETIRFVEYVLQQYGWPGYSLVGKEGSHQFWLLVQHTDQALDVQQRALTLLQRAVQSGDASTVDEAYLTDRVLQNEGKRQQYGTQFVIDEKQLCLYPVQDEKNLAERRSAVGLPPLEEEWKRLEEEYKNLLK
jgi:hypothetical protein